MTKYFVCIDWLYVCLVSMMSVRVPLFTLDRPLAYLPIFFAISCLLAYPPAAYPSACQLACSLPVGDCEERKQLEKS